MCVIYFYRGKRAEPDEPKGESGIFLLHGFLLSIESSQNLTERSNISQLSGFQAQCYRNLVTLAAQAAPLSLEDLIDETARKAVFACPFRNGYAGAFY